MLHVHLCLIIVIILRTVDKVSEFSSFHGDMLLHMLIISHFRFRSVALCVEILLIVLPNAVITTETRLYP